MIEASEVAAVPSWLSEVRAVLEGRARWCVIEGDCLEVLPLLARHFGFVVDAVVTDPPYHLTQLSRNGSPRQFVDNPYGMPSVGQDKGFMGKTWDGGDVAFRVPTWERVLSVAKPGAHMVAAGGTRTFHRLACAIEDAGWEVRDSILAFLHGRGFPKSHDVSKAIDAHHGAERPVVGTWKPTGTARVKGAGNIATSGQGSAEGELRDELPITGPATKDAQTWDGYGSALKPGWEPLFLVRKSLEGTIAANVLRHGTGAMNIDACRLQTGDNLNGGAYAKEGSPRYDGAENWRYKREGGAGVYTPPEGRWPPNVALVHAEGCRSTGTTKTLCHKPTAGSTPTTGAVNGSGFRRSTRCGAGDAEGMETVEVWECEEDCPVRLLDEPNGSHPGMTRRVLRRGVESGKGLGFPTTSKPGDVLAGYGDSGGVSRFFYTSKAKQSERWCLPKCGCDLPPCPVPEAMDRTVRLGSGIVCMKCKQVRTHNAHPTVKPLDLTRWLCRLLAPKGAVVLDPFAGSGTTGVAALLEGQRVILIECDPEYARICRARLQATCAQEPV